MLCNMCHCGAQGERYQPVMDKVYDESYSEISPNASLEF